MEFCAENSLVRYCHVRDCPFHCDHYCSLMKSHVGFIPYAMSFVPDGSHCRLHISDAIYIVLEGRLVAFSKERLDALIKGELNYGVFVNGSCVFQTMDLMTAIQQFDYIRKQHSKENVEFKILEAYENESKS